MKWATRAFICMALGAGLAACGPRLYQGPNAALEHNVAISLLVGYDSDGNGLLSRDEFENALRTDFASLDRNSDQFLDRIEIGDENDRRWRVSGTAASPLIDWNADGFVDFTEFAATFRATFTQLDTNVDDGLSAAELAVVEDRGPPRRGEGARDWPQSAPPAPVGGTGPETQAYPLHSALAGPDLH